MEYLIREKFDIPTTYSWEVSRYTQLAFLTKTTSGAYSEVSTSSGVTYSGSDGTQGLFNQLASALNGYQITAVDWDAIRSWVYGGLIPVVNGLKETMVYTGSDLTSVFLYKADLITVIARQDFTYGSGNLITARMRVYDSDGLTVLVDYTDTMTYSGSDLSYVIRTVTV